MTAAPEAIIAAIAEAINAETGYVYEPGDRLLADIAAEAYKAAESAIAAVQRERIAKLADLHQATYPVDCHASWCKGNGRHGVHHIELAPLIRELGDEPSPCETPHVLPVGGGQ
jgi:hypothetical protein